MNTEIDISNVTLHTDCMILRPWRQTDLDDLYAYASVDGVGQMAGWKPHESKEESQKILDMFIGHKKTFASDLLSVLSNTMKITFPNLQIKSAVRLGMCSLKSIGGKD